MATAPNGSSGSDLITATSAGGAISAGAGDDTVFGGSGNDTLNGDAGNDTLVYNIEQNSAGTRDVYTGGSGTDTVLIQFTMTQWLDSANQQQIAAYLAHLAAVRNAKTGEVSNALASDFTFTFGSSTLTVQMMEQLRVTVAGVEINPADAAVTAGNDAASAAADAGPVSIAFFANDAAPDLVKSVVVTAAPAHGTVVLVKPDAGNPATWRFDYQADNAHYQYLAAGQTATDTFTYKLTDADDDFATATVTITITGTNDAPTISAAVATGAVREDDASPTLVTTGTVTFDDVDLLDVHGVTVTARPGNALAGTVTAGVTTAATGAATGTVTWNYAVANSATQSLAAGQTVTELFDVVIADGHGGTVTQTVSVTITGVNDPAALSSAVANLIEGNAVAAISTSGALTISDVDGPATFVAQSGTAGTYGSFSVNAAGAWVYTASSPHDEFVAGTTYTDTFSVASADGTTTSVTINVLGTNDAAQLAAVTKALTEANTAAALSTSGTLDISDVDSPATFVAQTGTAGAYGSFSIDAAGAWVYTASSAHDEFAGGTTYTDTFTVASADGTATTVTIDMLGANDAAVLSSDTKNLNEANTAAAISTSGTLTITDVDSPATFVAQTATAGTYGSFSIDAGGAWVYAASSAHDEFVDGTTYTDTFNVASTDGTATSVTINILGTNDSAVLSSDTSNLSEANTTAAISTSGTLTISDVDSPATFVAQTATAGTYGSFSINAAGAWVYTASSAHDEFVDGTTYTDTFNVASVDGTGTTVTINILGTNDSAVLSSDTKNLDEADSAAAISTSGTLTITDVDSPATFIAQTATAGTYGSFSIDAAGAWLYTASSGHDEFVAGTTYTDTFNVTSADGTATSVTINILGTNDDALLSSDTKNLSEANTAAAISTSGSLTITDVDSPATFVAQTSTTGTYGSFSIDAAGAWVYTASSAHDEFVDGTTYTDVFNVASVDGTATTVTINILGTNDAAILSSDTKNLSEANTAVAISTSGTLTISDVDSPAIFVAQTGTAGTYGSFSIDAGGTWVYTASSAHDEFVAGTTYTDTFNVASSDGTATSVTINILGTNDDAVLSSDTKNLSEANTAAAISTSGTLTISDVDSPATFVAQPGTDGTYGSFSIDAAGAWAYTANSAHDEFVDGTTYMDTFDVASADGTTTSVTINILGTNDAAAMSSETQNLNEANTAAAVSSSGSLTISDVDSPATFVAQTGTVGTFGSFSIDAAGAWVYTASSAHDEFAAGTTYTDTFNVASADGSSTSVTINILGTNDAAVLSSDTKNLIETNTAAAISTSGTLTISDVDGPATFVAQSGVAGNYGAFSITAAGAWTYTASSAHDEFVAGTTYTDTFSVTSTDGATTSVQVNILGTNDPAVLSPQTRNLTEGNTAAAISTSGTLTISDLDSAATFVAQPGTVGAYGTFALGATGAWTYTASSAHDEFVAGTTYTDVFTVAAADGTTTSVTINILGTAEAPAGPNGGADNIITNAATGTAFVVPEWALLANDTLTAGGSLDVAGVSGASGVTAVHAPGTGTNGTVTITDAAPAGGTFLYTPTDGTASGAATLATVSKSASDSITGTGGADIIVSGSGGATLNGGGGNDVLLGGSGNDTIVFGLADGNDTISDLGGTDAIQVTTSAPVDSATVTPLGFEQLNSTDLLITVGGTQVLVKNHYNAAGSAAGNGAVESITFTNGGLYHGYAISASAYALASALATSGNQRDVIASSSAQQSLDGANGNDMLFGNGGNDTISGGSGGTSGNDLLVGGAGNDSLSGFNDNDVLVGGTGADTLIGGAGNDVFVFDVADGSIDVIADMDANAVDKIRLSASAFAGIGAGSAVGTALAASDFAVVTGAGTGATATVGASVNVIFNSTDGKLYYDADGNGAGGRTQIAIVTLTGVMDLADFVVGT